jgi:dethiobiotin synthetase
MKGCFITGTDTGVGKTFFTALWTRMLRAKGQSAFAFKPILCGERVDAEILCHANDEKLSIDQINPVWLMPPLAPYSASLVEDRAFDWQKLRNHWAWVRDSVPGPILVEGVGGWLVPIDRQMSVREWAMELGLPVVIVCRAGLGTINHTMLTVENVRASGLKILGLVMNFHNTVDDLSVQTNPAVVEELTGLPLLKLDSKAQSMEIPTWLSF